VEWSLHNKNRIW